MEGLWAREIWLLRREADMRGAPRKEKRCQEPFRYASSLARNSHGQHGGPWSVNTRAGWDARAGQNGTGQAGLWGVSCLTLACSRHRGARFICGRCRAVQLPGAAEGWRFAWHSGSWPTVAAEDLDAWRDSLKKRSHAP